MAIAEKRLIDALNPTMRIGRVPTLDIDQLLAQLLGDLPWSTCTNTKAAAFAVDAAN